MNPFKCVCGRRCKRKSKCVEVEVKQEPGIKEEPYDGESVSDVPWPTVDSSCLANYEGPVNFDDDFEEVKHEVKSEEEMSEEEDSAACERSNGRGAGSNDNNENPMDVARNGQSPQPAESGAKRAVSSKGRNKRAIPRNQASQEQKKYKCHVCSHLVRSNCDLKVHLRTHTGEKPFQCDVCSKCFAHKSNLNAHKKTHGPKPKFCCSKCYQRFEQESDKIDHERLCNPQQFECDICGYHCVKKSSLTVHMHTHSGEKPFECSICFKRFTANSSLQRHSMIHIDGPPNACAKCGRRFAAPEAKQTHEARCQRSPFACNLCHYKTIRKTDLKRHMQSKHGAKTSFECEICQKQFVECIRLNQHLSTAHSDQFPFKCSKCLGGYATEEAKELHEGNCGWRQYQCHLCKKYRRDKEMLKIHMRKDHTAERIHCKMCAAGFTRKSVANQHLKTVHRLKK